jgi:hypothetical protein
LLETADDPAQPVTDRTQAEADLALGASTVVFVHNGRVITNPHGTFTLTDPWGTYGTVLAFWWLLTWSQRRVTVSIRLC